jgi:hypothetical protein
VGHPRARGTDGEDVRLLDCGCLSTPLSMRSAWMTSHRLRSRRSAGDRSLAVSVRGGEPTVPPTQIHADASHGDYRSGLLRESDTGRLHIFTYHR